MKIQLASDLHLEFLQSRWPGERLIAPVPGADVLVLAGDIADGARVFELFAHWPTPVIYVAGNHEFYGHAIDPMREKMRESSALCGIHFLENESLVIGGVRFLGTTLWTDYRLRSNRTQSELMEHAQRGLNDPQLIRIGRRRFSAHDALGQHERARVWLESELAQPFASTTVVVSHHGPHPLSVHPRYAGDLLSAAFVSDLSSLMPGIDLWLHGHVHDGFDYEVGRCRVVANPAGYVLNRSYAQRDDFEFENPLYDRNLVIEVST